MTVMRGWMMAWVISGTVLGVPACGTDAQQSCNVGSRDCACTLGGGCDAGLSCVEGTCILVETSDGPSDSTGPATSETATSTSGTSANTTNPMGETSTSSDPSSTGGGPVLDVGSKDTDIGPTSGCQAIDVLFALDESGSMNEERNALAATNAFSQILGTLEGLNGGGIAFRVGLTSSSDHGFMTPQGWNFADPPWFDSESLDLQTMSLAFNGAVGQMSQLGDPPTGCEHALTSAVNLLAQDTSGFVREDALLVLVLLTDVDDFGAYDQVDGNSCGLGCTATPSDLNAMQTLLVDSIKAGQEDGVSVIAIAGDPTSNDGVNFCDQPGSCGCGGVDCGVFHATRLYEFTDMLGERGIAADLCGANIPMVVEGVLNDSIDQICQDFEPEG